MGAHAPLLCHHLNPIKGTSIFESACIDILDFSSSGKNSTVIYPTKAMLNLVPSLQQIYVISSYWVYNFKMLMSIWFLLFRVKPLFAPFVELIKKSCIQSRVLVSHVSNWWLKKNESRQTLELNRSAWHINTLCFWICMLFFRTMLNTDGLKFLKNNAIRGNSWECIILVKVQYPKTFKATFYSSFTKIISCDGE